MTGETTLIEGNHYTWSKLVPRSTRVLRYIAGRWSDKDGTSHDAEQLTSEGWNLIGATETD